MHLRHTVLFLLTLVFAAAGCNEKVDSISAKNNDVFSTAQIDPSPKTPVESPPTLKESEPEFRWVQFPKGIELRESPDPNGEIIKVIPENEKVTFIQEAGTLQKISGYSGKWSFIKWGRKRGWVFGGFLTKSQSQKKPEPVQSLIRRIWGDNVWAEFKPSRIELWSNSEQFLPLKIGGVSPEIGNLPVLKIRLKNTIAGITAGIKMESNDSYSYSWGSSSLKLDETRNNGSIISANLFDNRLTLGSKVYIGMKKRSYLKQLFPGAASIDAFLPYNQICFYLGPFADPYQLEFRADTLYNVYSRVHFD